MIMGDIFCGIRHFFLNLNKLSPIDSILVHFVLLNYFLVIPSTIIGIMSTNIISYYWLFFILIVMIYIVMIIRKRKSIVNLLSNVMLHTVKRERICTISVVMLWYIYICLIIIYTPIFRNYDAFAIYLPMANAIQTTGSLHYNPYFLSEIQMVRPPLFPILYSLVMSFFGISFIKLIPFIYFVFLIFVVYNIGLELFDTNTSILLVFLLGSSLIIHVYFAAASLFIDLSFICYALVTFLFLIKCHRDKKNQILWYFMLGLSSGLLFLSKEWGSFMCFMLVSLVLFSLLRLIKTRKGIILETAIAFFPFIYLALHHTLVSFIKGIEVQQHYVLFSSFILLFMFIYSYFSLIIYRKNPSENVENKFLKLILFLIPLGLSTIYMLYNFVTKGQIWMWTFRVNSILSREGIVHPAPISFDIMRYNPLKIVNLLTSFPMIMLLVPFLFSFSFFFLNIKKGKVPYEIMIILPFLIFSLFIWGYVGFKVYMFRVHMLFQILSLIIISYNYGAHGRRENGLKYQFRFFSISLAFAYAWFILDSNHIDFCFESTLVVNQPYLNLFDFFIFIIIYFPYLYSRIKVLRRVRIKIKLRPSPFLNRLVCKVRWKSGITKILFICTFAINMCMPSFLIYRSSTIISKNTWNPAFYADIRSINIFYSDRLIRIADYYSKLNDSYVTITFNMQRLPYIAKRPFFDLGWSDQTYLLLPLLKSFNETEIVKSLIDKNIQYFLLPTSTNPNYYLYSYYLSRSKLFQLVENHAFILTNETIYYFSFLKNFDATGYNLYKLNTYNMTVLRSYFDF